MYVCRHHIIVYTLFTILYLHPVHQSRVTCIKTMFRCLCICVIQLFNIVIWSYFWILVLSAFLLFDSSCMGQNRIHIWLDMIGWFNTISFGNRTWQWDRHTISGWFSHCEEKLHWCRISQQSPWYHHLCWLNHHRVSHTHMYIDIYIYNVIHVNYLIYIYINYHELPYIYILHQNISKLNQSSAVLFGSLKGRPVGGRHGSSQTLQASGPGLTKNFLWSKQQGFPWGFHGKISDDGLWWKLADEMAYDTIMAYDFWFMISWRTEILQFHHGIWYL